MQFRHQIPDLTVYRRELGRPVDALDCNRLGGGATVGPAAVMRELMRAD